MNLISAENLHKAYNERVLFTGLTLGISQGDKVALVGSNGAGKTTLLRMLAGLIPPDDGVVSQRKGLRVSYLAQQPHLAAGVTVRDVLFDPSNPVAAAVGAYEAFLHSGSEDHDRMAELLGAMDEHDAWDFESRVTQILGALSIYDLEAPADALSGGQRKRVALAQLLLSEPELVLLDEPTNHLDLEAIEWLERYLTTANTTLLMVTHDRYFLDAVCNQVIELDQGKIYRYKGNYAYFLEKKAERETIAQAEVDKARNLLVKELDWMRRQPKARGTKAKYRVDAFYDIKEKASQDLRRDSLNLDVKASRQGKKIIEIENLHYSIEDKVLMAGFSYIFQRSERVGIIGKNGTGKSTFLNLLTGRLQPKSGSVVIGETIKVGYYTQEVDNLNLENRVIDEVKAIADYVTLGSGEQVTAGKLLELFLFSPKAQYSFIAKLSGGEKRRLQLLKVLMASPNFLILDEPTNDLDIDTLNVLEDFLENYGGSLMLVSHDRYFMDKLVDHLFVFEGEGRIRDFPGNYSDWRQAQLDGTWQASAEVPKPAPVAAAASTPAATPVASDPVTLAEAPKKRKLTYKEQRELESLDLEIAQLENERDQLTLLLNEGNADHQQLHTWSARIEEIANLVDEKTLRWLELSE